MFKKIVALLLTAAVFTPIAPVSADSIGVADLTITDIRISNPKYKVGDVVSFEFDIKNIGTGAIELGWTKILMDQSSGISCIGNDYMWSRPWIFPGQTLTTVLDDFKITNRYGRITVAGNISNNGGGTETNRDNDTLIKSFTSYSTARNLVIEDISLSETNISDGNVATFDITYKNVGISDISQSDIEVKLTVGSQVYTVKENTAVMAGEKRTITSDPVYVKGDNVTVTAKINPNGKATENVTTDNEKTYTYEALVSKKSGYTWQPVRLGGGGWPRAGYVNENIEGQIFQLTDVNGLYKYNEYTKTYENITKTFDFGISENIGSGYSLGIGCQQDPVNPDIIYYAGGKRYSTEGSKDTCIVARTDDGGKTWRSLNSPFEFGIDMTFRNSIIKLDPNNSNVLYVSTAAGLWRTKNAKSASPTWEKLTIPNIAEVKANSSGIGTFSTPVTGVAVDKTSTVSNGLSQTVYAMVDTVGVYKSTNGGSTFTLMSGSPAMKFNDITVDSNGNLLVSGAIYLYSYSKSANTWTKLTTPANETTLTNNGIRLQSTVHPKNPNLIAVALNTYICEAIYYSEDRGATWTEILKSRGSGDYSGTVKNLMPWQTDTAIDSSPSWVAFDPFNDGRLFANAWFGTYQTLDYTATPVQWEETTYGIEETFVRSLLPMPEGARYELLLGANDFCGLGINNVFEFTAERFLPHTQETTGLAYMESDPNFVVRNGGSERGAGAGNGFYSTDGGVTWTEFPAYPMKDSGSVRQQAGKIVVASDKNANGNPTIMMVMLGSNDALPSGSTHGRVWRSEDLGNTWTWVESLPARAIERFLDTCEPLVADRVNKDKFYFYDFRTGNVYRSTDNGKTFTVVGSLPAGDTESSMLSVPGSEGELYASISYKGLFHSTDGGSTWTKIDAVERARYFDIGKAAPCSPDNFTLYILGQVKGTYGIFRSTDLGENWVQIDDPKQESIWNKITTIKADKREFGRVYVGTDGSGIIMGYLGGDRMKPRTAIYELIDGKSYLRNTPITVTGGSTKPGTVYISLNGNVTSYPLDENNRFTADLSFKLGTNTVIVYSIDDNGYKSDEVTYKVKGLYQ